MRSPFAEDEKNMLRGTWDVLKQTAPTAAPAADEVTQLCVTVQRIYGLTTFLGVPQSQLSVDHISLLAAARIPDPRRLFQQGSINVETYRESYVTTCVGLFESARNHVLFPYRPSTGEFS